MYQMNDYEIVKVHEGVLSSYPFAGNSLAKMEGEIFKISIWLLPGLMGTANVLSLMEPTKRVDFLHIREYFLFVGYDKPPPEIFPSLIAEKTRFC